jgi:hypothetical protein
LLLQVTTFALFRLMRELDGDMSDEQLSASGGVTLEQQMQTQTPGLALMQFVQAGAFSKLCQVCCWC